MAFYDNTHWLLSHIRNSFISGDDTGMSEIILSNQNLCQQVSDQNRYPGIEEDEEVNDVPNSSLEEGLDLDFGTRRERSNTALRLEKMGRIEKEDCNNRVKWSTPRPFISITEEEKLEMFPFKEINVQPFSQISLLSQQLLNCKSLPKNPFREYAKYDGSIQVGIPIKKFGIYLTMLRPEHKNYPMYINIISTAKISDMIGFILWKCSVEYPEYPLKMDIVFYNLHIVEDDGEIDSAFPCLDPTECVSKFSFHILALVERSADEVKYEKEAFEKNENDHTPPIPDVKDDLDAVSDDSNLLQSYMSAIDALLYKSYKIHLLNKVRSKLEVNLGISGEKIDIDPVLTQSSSSKIFTKRKPVSYDIDLITACDLTETKSSNKAIFRLVYDSSAIMENDNDFSLLDKSWSDFKHHDFEAEQRVAEEIVQKINHVLNLRCSSRRSEYLAMRERKSHRRRSFHLGPR